MRNTDPLDVSPTILRMMADLGCLHGLDVGFVAYDDTIITSTQVLPVLSPQHKKDLQDAILSARRARDTDIGLGLMEAMSLLDASRREGARLAIILLSDGAIDVPRSPLGRTNADSQADVERVSQRCRELGIPIYTVGLSTHFDGDIDSLRDISSATGGAFYTAASPMQLTDILGGLFSTYTSSRMQVTSVKATGGEQEVRFALPPEPFGRTALSVFSSETLTDVRFEGTEFVEIGGADRYAVVEVASPQGANAVIRFTARAGQIVQIGCMTTLPLDGRLSASGEDGASLRPNAEGATSTVGMGDVGTRLSLVGTKELRFVYEKDGMPYRNAAFYGAMAAQIEVVGASGTGDAVESGGADGANIGGSAVGSDDADGRGGTGGVSGTVDTDGASGTVSAGGASGTVGSSKMVLSGVADADGIVFQVPALPEGDCSLSLHVLGPWTDQTWHFDAEAAAAPVVALTHEDQLTICGVLERYAYPLRERIPGMDGEVRVVATDGDDLRVNWDDPYLRISSMHDGTGVVHVQGKSDGATVDAYLKVEVVPFWVKYPLFAMLAGLALLLLAILLMARFAARRRAEGEPRVAAGMAAVPRISFTGSLAGYFIRLRSFDEVLPQRWSLAAFAGKKRISLYELLVTADLQDALPESRRIHFRPARDHALTLSHETGCTILVHGNVLTKGESATLHYGEKAHVTFEDGESELEIRYKKAMPNVE